MPTRRNDNDEAPLARLESMIEQRREEHDRLIERVKSSHQEARETVYRSHAGSIANYECQRELGKSRTHPDELTIRSALLGDRSPTPAAAVRFRDRLSRMRWIPFLLLFGVSLAAQVAAPNEAGVSVGHVHLVVADPDAQKKLWVDLLGGELKSLPPLQLVKFPGILVVLQKAQNPPTEGSDGSTANHFGFLVKSYADIKAKLAAQHLEFAMDNVNSKQVIAVFPEKIRVEFTEDPNLTAPIAFHHFHVAATDQQGLRDWYVKTFAARAGNRGNFPAAFVPGGEVDFLKANAAAAPTKGRSLDHIGFEVKDLETFCKKLQADGVTIEMAYRDIPQIALKIAFLTDPDGTRIELTEGLAGK